MLILIPFFRVMAERTASSGGGAGASSAWTLPMARSYSPRSRASRARARLLSCSGKISLPRPHSGMGKMRNALSVTLINCCNSATTRSTEFNSGKAASTGLPTFTNKRKSIRETPQKSTFPRDAAAFSEAKRKFFNFFCKFSILSLDLFSKQYIMS